MNEFCLGFHWNLLLRFKWTIFHHWFRKWLGADQATSHYLNQWWLIYWRIYTSLGLNELTGYQIYIHGSDSNLTATSGFSSQRTINMEMWCYPCHKHELVVEQMVQMMVIWDTIMLMCNIIVKVRSIIWWKYNHTYRKVSNIRSTKSQNLNASRLIL